MPQAKKNTVFTLSIIISLHYLFNLDDFQKAYNICCHMIDVIESDERYEFIHAAPFWMTRFNLYSDDQYDVNINFKG